MAPKSPLNQVYKIIIDKLFIYKQKNPYTYNNNDYMLTAIHYVHIGERCVGCKIEKLERRMPKNLP